MATATRKFNPGFLSEDELVASFCVRTHEFESIIETLRGCTGNSNQHQMVIGPRGSGKTTLLLRVAAEIGHDAELSRRFFPIRFAEESYEVSTAGEFWLECLCQLAEQAASEEDGPDLRRTCKELRTIQDDRALADRCLGTLLDFSDRQGKRLVLLVENLNMMFRDMVDPDAGWRLRYTLQTESRIVLLASATSRFDEIDNPDSALYELLRVHSLAPLDTGECKTLWQTASGESASREKVRPLEILTGGSPRLLAIVARLGAGRSLGDLLDDLLDLIDDHTEYFKSHIEALPAQERRVYLALAELWEPATTKEVADRARLDTNKCSAQLKRLSDRGAVRVVGGSARRKQFYLTERLYNIYYLLRRHRGPNRVVRALLRFMSSYYSGFEDDARAAFGDTLERVKGARHDAASDRRTRVQLLKGNLELDCKEYESASQAASEALDNGPDGDPELRIQALLLRTRSALLDAPAAAENDLAAALELLPALDPLPREAFSALADAAVELGPASLLKLIESSASAELLLPIQTALQLELGRTPRVSREVEEVAKDIRRGLRAALQERAGMREDTHPASGGAS